MLNLNEIKISILNDKNIKNGKIELSEEEIYQSVLESLILLRPDNNFDVILVTIAAVEKWIKSNNLIINDKVKFIIMRNSLKHVLKILLEMGKLDRYDVDRFKFFIITSGADITSLIDMVVRGSNNHEIMSGKQKLHKNKEENKCCSCFR